MVLVYMKPGISATKFPESVAKLVNFSVQSSARKQALKHSLSNIVHELCQSQEACSIMHKSI